MMQLGDLHKLEDDTFDFSGFDGFDNRFGFQDDTTMALLKHLVEQGKLPDFTVAYLPDNDWNSHSDGPHRAMYSLEHVDELLGELFSIEGGLESFLSKYTIFIVGDHSQSYLVADEDRRGINLNDILQDFNLGKAGATWADKDDIIACPNLRATLFYFNRVTPTRFERLSQCLLADNRVDQVIWCADLMDENSLGYCVRSVHGGLLHFWDESETPMAYDRYGNGWSWDGALQAVDGVVSDNGLVTFDRYPNAFECIKNILDLERSGDVWATAKPGYTFHLDEMDYEVGGSHGALHMLDSTTSLIVAGHEDDLSIPDVPRIVDVAPLILRQFNM